MRGRTAVLLWMCLLAVTVLVLLIVLSPSRPAGEGQDSLRLWIEQAHQRWLPGFVTFDRIEWSANVVMFLPIGFFGGLLVRWPAALVSALVLSAAVESLQHFLLSERVGSVLDVLANVSGAALGVAVALLLLRLQRGVRGRACRVIVF